MWRPPGSSDMYPIPGTSFLPHYYYYNLAPSSASAGTNQAIQHNTISSQALAPQSSRKRRISKPKVRTGCRTCKIRRIKCDERKPNCFKCSSTGRKCDGYEFSSGDSRPNASSRAILPPQRPHATFTQIFLPTSLSLAVPGTTQERRAFHRFQACTVPAFIGGSEGPFWTSLVLKAGKEDSVVRSAIIALGTLHEDYQDRGGIYNPKLHEEPSFRLAVSLYGKALRQARERLVETTPDNSRSVIITCILFACFEVLRRNNMAAVVHYQAGMRELMRQISSAQPTDIPLMESKPMALVRQAPQSDFDQLIRVFARYDIQAVTFSKGSAEELAMHLEPTPPVDMTLPQIRQHLDNLLIAVYQMVSSDLSMYRYRDQGDAPEDYVTRRKHALKIFDAWVAALQKCYDEREDSLSPQDAKGLLGLLMQIKVAMIQLVLCIDCKAETNFDRFRPEFEDIVQRTDRMISKFQLTNTKPLDVEQVPFTMDLGLVHPLFFVATKCRDWALRRLAIAQLRKVGKEGVWEGPIMAVVADRIMRIEEHDVPWGAPIPETMRLHKITKNVMYDLRVVRIEATRAVDETFLKWETLREDIPF